MREQKNIPFKNYIILAVVLILSISIVIYFYMWYGEIEKNKMSTPIMDEYLSVINYNELDDYLVENKDIVIYVSTLNEKTRKFENKFKRIMKDYYLNNNLLYLNLTEVNDKKINSFKNNYNINSLPCIITFKNEMVYDVYYINTEDYDLDFLVSYLEFRGVISD